MMNSFVLSLEAIMNQMTIQRQPKKQLHTHMEVDTISNSKDKKPSYKIILITL